MKTTINTKNRSDVIFQSIGDSFFQILKYNNEITNNSLMQIRVVLKNSTIKVQNEILSFMKGDIDIKHKKVKAACFAKRLLGMDKISQKTLLSGTGEVFFRPSFKYFTIVELEDEEIVIDDKIFYVCEGTIRITIENKDELLVSHKTEIKLSGTGIVILSIPISEEEIIRCKLFNDKLTVAGNYAILRSGSIECNVYDFNKNIDDELKRIEVMKNYEGVGEVWLLPALSCCEEYINESAGE